MTTTTEKPGCCMGDCAKSNLMCSAREGRDRQEKSSSCYFVSGGVLKHDCVIVSTLTEPWCYINPDTAHSTKYHGTCTSFNTKRDCLKLTDSNGATHCAFEQLADGHGCSLLWPTTTTTTEEPGFCCSFSYKALAKCLPDRLRAQALRVDGE